MGELNIELRNGEAMAKRVLDLASFRSVDLEAHTSVFQVSSSLGLPSTGSIILRTLSLHGDL